MNSRRNNNIQKGLRDYMVPIIGGLLVILLLFSVFSGDNNTPKIDPENKVGFDVKINGTNSEAYIVYQGDTKKKIEGDISLYKGEKIIVKEGNASLVMEGIGKFRLDKLGEFKYMENGFFSLYSSDLWLDSSSEVNVDMKFAKINVGANTHISFGQNEMGSTVYLLSGTAEVENLVGKSTVLGAGQKVTVSRLDASKQDLNLSLLKDNIDDFYKQSDWFILNNGASYIKSETESGSLDEETEADDKTSTGKVVKSDKSTSVNSLLTFSNLSDESYVSSENINISGNYSDEEITKITLNGIDAVLNTKLKSFKFENISVKNQENNLVFKVYDDSEDLLSKFVYVVYFDGGETPDNNTVIKRGFNVQTFDVDGSQFTFTEPTTKETYTTFDDFVTIRGSVLVKGITKVTVNDFPLSSFNGSTWRYHASTTNNNLSVGTNVYNIKYFDSNGKEVYTNRFTIIRKTSGTTTDEQ
ncbi:MAG: hypothetical protein Q8K30_04445 [Candidatus Gracilibacteria bacterium]|nr:hypothetical protein [Candidatus Gracilibacteria bacterium]